MYKTDQTPGPGGGYGNKGGVPRGEIKRGLEAVSVNSKATFFAIDCIYSLGDPRAYSQCIAS